MAVCLAFLAWSPAKADCGPARLDTVTIERVLPEGDILLTDKRLIRLAGVHLSFPERIAFLLPGDRLAIGMLEATRDRWSRHSVLAFTMQAGRPSEWLQERLIREGVALARPEENFSGCWAQLMQTEAKYLQTLAVPKPEGGRFARIEGRVQRVSEGRSAHFISLSENRVDETGKKATTRIAGMIQKQHLKRFSDRGVDVRQLRGQLIRMRGVRNVRNATIIPLTHADQIEIIR